MTGSACKFSVSGSSRLRPVIMAATEIFSMSKARQHHPCEMKANKYQS